MSDCADRAASQEQLNFNVAMANRVNTPPLPKIGRCHNCHEPMDEQLFCDADCRDDYEQRKRVSRQN
ncbi:hypothetical protein [Shewanella surugensis]|uniref:DUF2116 family Zn-ribbon domain-containing protein n=1 Tax=Shewanella surugensis TaxID=212020 RepID=A0ABT0LAE2_9GAMM|nr:hypothetical protein [Shewanella surugensis]MCL1124131.1 hypothetical protein [Shewanella surugensis]